MKEASQKKGDFRTPGGGEVRVVVGRGDLDSAWFLTWLCLSGGFANFSQPQTSHL